MSAHSPPSKTYTVHVPVAFALITLGGFALLIDVQLAAYLFENRPPGMVRKCIGMSEIFGYGYGTALAVLTIFVLDPSRRRFLPRFAAASVAASVCAHLGKMTIVRLRPRNPELENFTGTVLDTFRDWFPLLASDSEFQSFPSGHTANAVAMMLSLMWLYPRGRYLFPLFAVLAACQRVQSQAHFVSDVFFGAALGYIVALLVLSSRTDRWFKRWEKVGNSESA